MYVIAYQKASTEIVLLIKLLYFTLNICVTTDDPSSFYNLKLPNCESYEIVHASGKKE